MMPLFNVSLPANAGLFFAQMMSIAAFEVVDTKPYLDKYLGLEPSEPLNSNFEALGFESVYVLHNMGTLALAFVIYAAAVAFSYLLKSIDHKKSNEVGEELQRKLFWRTYINLVIESYLSMAVSCLINLQMLRWNSFSIGLMSVLALLITLFIIVFFCFYAIET